MKKIARLLVIAIISLVIVIVVSIFWGRNTETSVNAELCSELREYCEKHDLRTDRCIVVDFSIYSGKERLFIVDMVNNRIDMSTLSAHGLGKYVDCIFHPKFSNDPESHYSSLGHYKLGTSRMTSQYNLRCIELYGLDGTNSNAYQRGILIHNGLPDITIIGLPCLPLSLGCFTIPDEKFNAILHVKESAKKPLLLYATNKSIFSSSKQ